MNNILLIQTRNYNQQELILPTQLLYLAANIKKHKIKVDVIDTNIEKNYSKKILHTIKNNKPTIVGITVMSGDQTISGIEIFSAINISKKIKKINSEIKIVWIGIISNEFKEVLKNEFVDITISGEPEEVFIELAENKPIEKIKGISYKQNNIINTNEIRPPTNINLLPTQAFELINLNDYGFFNLHTTRGCPKICNFCSRPLKGKVREKSPEKMIQEVKSLIKYGIKNIGFMGEALLLNKKRIRKFIELLEKEKINISWRTWGQINFLKEKIYLKELANSGLKQLSIGIESYSKERRRMMEKYFSNESVFLVMNNCKENNINITPSLIIGYPKDTIEEVNKTITFAKLIENKYGIKSRIIPYREYPGSKLANKNNSKKKLLDWAKNFIVLEKLSEVNPIKLELISITAYYLDLNRRRKLQQKRTSSKDKLVQLISQFRWKYEFWNLPFEVYINRTKIIMKIFFDRFN